LKSGSCDLPFEIPTFAGCSAQNVLWVTEGSRIEEAERRTIAIHPVLRIGFLLATIALVKD